MSRYLTSLVILVLSVMGNSMTQASSQNEPGNSPVVDIPLDYYPPGSGNWFEIPQGKDAGKKLFYRDSNHFGSNPQTTLVFVHGNPESSYTYRKVIDHLLNSTTDALRIVAMDHIGFGLSDQASYEMVSMDHAENLLQLFQHLDLDNATLIVHDWGGPIGIGAALQEHERFNNLVVLNSTVFPMPPEGRTYNNFPLKLLSWAKIPSVMPDNLWGAYASYAIFVTRSSILKTFSDLIAYLWQSEHGEYPEDDRVARKFFRDQFQSDTNVRMSKRMVRQSGHWGHGNRFWDPNIGWRDTSDFYQTIQNEISEKWGPNGANIGVRAIIGGWDPLGKKEVISQWTDKLPQLQGNVTIFEDVGHFIEEVKYKDIANAIVDVSTLQ